MKYKIIPQQEIFWHQEYTGTYSSNNNIFLVVEVDEIFDQNHLNRCYNKLISEFDVLRSRFYLDNSGSPIFSIQPSTSWTGVKNEGIWDIGIKNC